MLASALRVTPRPGFTFPPLRRPGTWGFCHTASSKFYRQSSVQALAKLFRTTPSADFSTAITNLAARSAKEIS